MTRVLDIALVIAIGLWAMLEFYYKIEFGPLNALILFGLIWRFAVMPSFQPKAGQQPGSEQ